MSSVREENDRILLNTFFNLVKCTESKQQQEKFINKIKMKNINHQYYGESLLHRVVKKGFYDVVEHLLKCGADPSLKNDQGKTPLHLADGNADILKLIQDHLIKQKALETEEPFSYKESPSLSVLEKNKQKEKFDKGPSPGIEGQLYEIMLSALYLLRCTLNRMNFKLATNVKSMGKFDDVILKVYNKNEDIILVKCVQAKHIIKATNISKNDLITTEDANFSLVKYYFSYVELKDSKDIPIDVSQFIIFTNLELHKEVKKFFIGYDKSDILNIEYSERKSELLQLIKDTSLIKDLHHNIQDYMCTKVCMALLDHIIDGKNIDLRKSSLKTHFSYLTQKVIEVNNENIIIGFQKIFLEENNANTEEEFYFRDKFQSTLLNKYDKLRKKIQEKIKSNSSLFESKFGELISQNQRFSIDHVHSYLSIIKLKVDNYDGMPDEIMAWPLICDQDINDFLTKLVVAINQVDMDQLQEILSMELKNLSALAPQFLFKILDWYKEIIQSDYLTQEDGIQFLNELELKLVNLKFCKEINDFKVLFTTTHLDVFQEVANKNACIVNIETHHNSILTIIKMYQALCLDEKKKMKIISEKRSIVFLPSDICLKCDTLINNTFNTGWIRIIVVDCETSHYDQVNKMFSKLLATNTSNAPLIIIISQQFTFTRICDIEDTFNFEFLNLETQQLYLNKFVTFQGSRVAIKEILIDTEQDINDEIMVRLMKGKIIEIGTPLKYNNGIPFIDRCLHTPVAIRRGAFFDQDIKDIFAISNISIAEFQFVTQVANTLVINYKNIKPQTYYRYIILDDINTLKQYQDVCKDIGSKNNVHWLKYTHFGNTKPAGYNYKFIWQQTHGKISSLCKYRRKTVSQSTTTEEVLDKIDYRVMILSDTAGTGKSTLMKYLAHKTKTKFPDAWLIEINLNEHTKLLKEEANNIGFKKYNMDSAITFLHKLMSSSKENQQLSAWILALLQNYIRSDRKVFIFLDSFDEVSPTFTNLVLDLILNLRQTNITKIWITTRPIERTLEESLNVFSFGLKELSHKDQLKFLLDYSKQNDSAINLSDDVIETYNKSLLNFLSSYLTSVPLHLILIAKYFFGKTRGMDIEQAIYSNSIKNLSIVDFFEDFLMKIFEYYEKKYFLEVTPKIDGVLSVYYPKIINLFQMLAFYEQFPCHYFQFYFTNINISDVFEDIRKCGSENTGILCINLYNEPYIIHKSFSEFLVAQYLYGKFENDKLQTLDMFQTLGVLTNPKFSLIRRFLNDYLLKTPINLSVEVLKYTLFKSHLSTPLHTACQEGNIGLLKFFFSTLNDDAVDEIAKCLNADGDSLIHVAFKYEQYKVIQWLVHEAGIPVDTLDQNHSTIFLLAIKKKLDYNILETLIELGACVDYKNEENQTALHIVQTYPKPLSISKFLIDNNATINIADKNNNTPLHLALLNKAKVELIHLFMTSGAVCNTWNRMGETALHIAVRQRNLNAIQVMVNADNVHTVDQRGFSLLYRAFQNGNAKIIDILLDHSADINISKEEGTLFHYAVKKNDLELLDRLCKKKMYLEKINLTDDFGRTPLYFALEKTKLAVYLLNQGAAFNMTDAQGESLLHHAVSKSTDMELVNLLIDKIGVNVQDGEGKTPLHLVALTGKFELVKKLIALHADVNMKDVKGETPIFLAVRFARLDITKFLLTKVECVNLKNNEGRSIMHVAAGLFSTEMLQLLVSAGVAVDIQDNNGRTPMNVASTNTRYYHRMKNILNGQNATLRISTIPQATSPISTIPQGTLPISTIPQDTMHTNIPEDVNKKEKKDKFTKLVERKQEKLRDKKLKGIIKNKSFNKYKTTLKNAY